MQTFQHLPERRVWSIVADFLALLGDTIDTCQERHEPKLLLSPAAAGDCHRLDASNSSGITSSCHGLVEGSNGVAVAAVHGPHQEGDNAVRLLPAIILPAHFLALAGGVDAGAVDQWLPSWLRALPTGRLVRAVNEASLVSAMVRRCDLHGRAPYRRHSPASFDFLAASGKTGAYSAAAGAAACAARSLTMSSMGPTVPTVCHHRLNSIADPVMFRGTVGIASTASLGKASGLNLGELDRALLVQSVSFLGILATHCRGTLRPCRLPNDACGNDVDCKADGDASDDERSETGAASAARKKLGGEGSDGGVDQGKEILGALVRCLRRGTLRPGVGQSALSMPLQQSETVLPSRSVRTMTLDYIGRLASATAGAYSTPFTPDVVDDLLSPLDYGAHGIGVIRTGPGTTSTGHRIDSEGSMLDEISPKALKALVDIASVLLSSRGASAGFFVQGEEGIEPSHALHILVQCTAELARGACSSLSRTAGATVVMGEESNGGGPGRFSSLSLQDKTQLAVDIVCAVMKSHGASSPKQRMAWWRAFWQWDAPHAVAELSEYICRSVLGGTIQRVREGCPEGASSNTELRHRLLLSLAEWARDLGGVNALRSVGLAKPCAACLSQELARRHLYRETRDECPDSRTFALISRLALCPEGLDGLLCEHTGGIVEAVDVGLNCLGHLPTLAELLQSQAPDMRPVSDRHGRGDHGSSRRDGGKCAERGGVESGGREELRSLRNDEGNMRCLNFVRRLSWASTGSDLGGIGAKGRGAKHVERWVEWVVSRAAPQKMGERLSGGNEVLEEQKHGGGSSALYSDDIRVVALRLASDLATDLTTAMEIEARWSLGAALARQAEVEARADGMATAVVVDAGTGDSQDSRMAQNHDITLATSHHNSSDNADLVTARPDFSGTAGGESIVGVRTILDPVVLGRARLAISLTCAGGPTEDRHVRFRRLREAEAVAAGYMPGGGGRGSSSIGDALHPTPKPENVGISPGVVDFPAIDLVDGDWCAAADTCVSRVVAYLASPSPCGGQRAVEAFALLSEAAAKKGNFLPFNHETPLRRTPHVVTESLDPNGDFRGSCRGANGNHSSSIPSAETVAPPGAMEMYCFSYARSLGFVEEESGNHFVIDMRRTLAAAAAGATAAATSLDTVLEPTAWPSHTASAAAADPSSRRECDWFAAVCFLTSAGVRTVGGEAGERATAANEMLANLSRHVHRAAFVWPLAGRRYTSARQSITAASASPVAGDGKNNDDVRHPAPALGAAAGAEVCRGDTPLMLLTGLVEEVMEEELPRLSAALRNAGWAAAPLAMRWMHQCMLGVMDWPGVVAYLALALIRGPDYQVCSWKYVVPGKHKSHGTIQQRTRNLSGRVCIT